MKKLDIIISIIILLYYTIYAYEIKGDECFHKEKNSTGVCKLFNDCETAKHELKHGIHPQTCGFEGKSPIICCIYTTGEISKKKCKEYGETVYKRIEPLIAIDESSSNIKYADCNFNNFLIRGEYAREREFPHMALIGRKNDNTINWFCSGSLISKHYVLTTAACALHIEPPNLIRLGEHNVSNSNKKDIQTFQIHKINMHNDIALIKLLNPVNITDFVRPACLITNEEVDQTKNFIIAGWGEKDENFEGLRQDNTVKKVDNNKCAQMYKDETYLCANTSLTSTCHIKSGAALQYYNKELQCMYNVAGILLSSEKCGTVPQVYIKVSSYLNWIENIVWNE